jgi:hypothetical protein
VTAPALDLVSDDATPSAARHALADHLANVARAQLDLERAGKPAERLRERLRAAEAELAAAEAALGAVDAQYAAEFRRAAEKGVVIELGRPPERAKAEAGNRPRPTYLQRRTSRGGRVRRGGARTCEPHWMI